MAFRFTKLEPWILLLAFLARFCRAECALELFDSDKSIDQNLSECLVYRHIKRDFAICLVQRTSIVEIIHCTDEGDLNPLLEHYPSFMDTHGIGFFEEGEEPTIKNILNEAAMAPTCRSEGSKMARAIQDCPYNGDWERFRSCLCCQNIDLEDIKHFTNCIYDHKFSDDHFWDEIMDKVKDFGRRIVDDTQWSCSACCVDYRRGPDSGDMITSTQIAQCLGGTIVRATAMSNWLIPSASSTSSARLQTVTMTVSMPPIPKSSGVSTHPTESSHGVSTHPTESEGTAPTHKVVLGVVALAALAI